MSYFRLFLLLTTILFSNEAFFSTDFNSKLKACAGNPQCMMDAMGELSEEIIKIKPLSPEIVAKLEACNGNDECINKAFPHGFDVIQPQQTNNNCSLFSYMNDYEHCIPLDLEISYKYKSEDYDSTQLDCGEINCESKKYLDDKKELAFNYKVKGLLFYNDNLDDFKLFQVHSPFFKDIRLQKAYHLNQYLNPQGNYEVREDFNGRKKDIWHSKDLTGTGFFIKGSKGKNIEIGFEPLKIQRGKMEVDTYGIDKDGDFKAFISKSKIRQLIKSKSKWNHRVDLTKIYDDKGSKTSLSFSVLVKKEKVKEKWRLSMYGKDSLLFGDNHGGGNVGGGVRVSWKSDIDFELEDGKYKIGQGKSYFVSIKPISTPAGVFDCMILNNGNIMKYNNYQVTGSLDGANVTLNIPENSYSVSYQCITDTDALRDKYTDYYRKIKWGTEAQIKDRVESDIRAVTKLKTQHFYNQPISSKWATTIPLQNGWSKELGTTGSINYEGMRLKKRE